MPRGREMPVLTSEHGAYVLILRLHTRRNIRVGRLGDFACGPGYYAYVGSARGPGGVAARVGRHLRRHKPRRWHIDYLRAAAEPFEVWTTAAENPSLEHAFAHALEAMRFLQPSIAGFGSSDCGCRTHLFHSTRRPSLRAFRRRAGHSSSAPIHSAWPGSVGQETDS
jgi:Uri superfamily endonuclease